MDTAAQTFLILGALLLLGLLADELGEHLKLPSVTILLVLGVVAGPEAADLLPEATAEWFPIVSTLALTMVGFLLGAAFTTDNLRDNGRNDLQLAGTEGVLHGRGRGGRPAHRRRRRRHLALAGRNCGGHRSRSDSGGDPGATGRGSLHAGRSNPSLPWTTSPP